MNATISLPRIDLLEGAEEIWDYGNIEQRRRLSGVIKPFYRQLVERDVDLEEQVRKIRSDGTKKQKAKLNQVILAILLEVEANPPTDEERLSHGF